MSLEAEEIEKMSLEIIERKVPVPFPEKEVVKRVIHATADLDFLNLIIFNENVIRKGIEAVRSGKDIITDVNMVKAGINSKKLARFGGNVKCFIEEDETFETSKTLGVTRARAAFNVFKDELDGNIVAIGNAPTSLFELCALIDRGIRPAVVVAAPVGFVGAKEAKEEILNYNLPSIVIRGNKGGSSVAVAIVNALIGLAEGND